MPLDHCYVFGLLLWPFGLKKKFLEGDPRDFLLPRPRSAPVRIWPKNNNACRDHEYFITTKFHQNPPSGSEEEVENWKFYGRKTTDGRCAMTIAYLSLRLRWAKNEKCKPGNRHYFESLEYRDVTSNKAIEFWLDCLTMFAI